MTPVNLYKEKKRRHFGFLGGGGRATHATHSAANTHSNPPNRLMLLMIFCMGCLIGFSSWLQSQFWIALPTPPPAPLNPSLIGDSDWNDFQQDYQGRFGRPETPPGMRSWLAFARMHQCSERDFYQDMDDDLAFFRSIIQKEGHKKFRRADIVPTGLDQTDNYMAFKLQHHQLQVIASRNAGNNDREQRQIEQLLRWILEPIRVHEPKLDATYFFNLHDGATPAKDTTKRPIFSVCKQGYWTESKQPPTYNINFDSFKGQHHYLSNHPDYHDWAAFESRDIMVPYHFGYDSADSIIIQSDNTLPFSQRQESLVWRGSTTGSVWGESPRFRLIREYSGGTDAAYQLSDQVPVMMDLAFVNVMQNDAGQTLAPRSRTGDRLEFHELQQHKYIMDVDGNAFTSRFPGLLKSGSLIFKSTRYREWYTERLRPYVDYVPVNYNLTDLTQKIQWAHAHPQDAAKITQHAQQTASKFLRRQDMRCYMYRLLLEYQTLFED